MRRIALEVARTSVRVLVLEGHVARPRVTHFLVEPLTGEPTAAFLQRVAGLSQSATTLLVSAIPREQTIIRLLQLPATSREELTQMVELTGKAQLPYPRDQVMADFQVIEQQGGTSTVQLVACHQGVIERHLATLRQGGLEPSLVTPTSWGLLGWYQRFGRVAQVAEPVVILHVDTDRTDLVVIRRTRILFSRSLIQGVTEWQLPTDGLGAIATEVERSLSIVGREFPGLDIASVILTGLGPLEQWKAFFEPRLSKPVMAIAPQGDLEIPAPTQPASPAVALGLAVAEETWLVNLLPLETRSAQQHRRRIRELVVTGLLLLSTLLVGAGLLSASVRRQERATRLLMTSLKQLEATTQQTERQQQDIARIERVVQSRQWTGQMLAECVRLTPAEIMFESLVFDQDRGELIVRGNAPSTRHVLDYVRQLEGSDRWAKVELRYSARRGTSADARTDFEIALHHHA